MQGDLPVHEALPPNATPKQALARVLADAVLAAQLWRIEPRLGLQDGRGSWARACVIPKQCDE